MLFKNFKRQPSNVQNKEQLVNSQLFSVQEYYSTEGNIGASSRGKSFSNAPFR